MKIYPVKWNLLKRKMVPEISRSRYIIQQKYEIEINLLSTIYLLLTLPEVMMVNLNHKPSKNVRRRNDWPMWNSNRTKLMSKI
jgi:hypothetical protein